MKGDFDKWLKTFKIAIADYEYFTDFQKVYGNAEAVKVELNILNSLVGSKAIEKDFDSIVKRYPSVLKCIPLLLAVRSSEIRVYDGGMERLYDFAEMNASPDDCKAFMRKTGLFDLMKNILSAILWITLPAWKQGLIQMGERTAAGT